MDDRVERRVLLAGICIAVLLPLVVIALKPSYGILALVAGLAVAAGCGYMLRMPNARAALPSQEALYARRERSRTIYVQLVDDDGRELPPEIAEARLTEARLNAGRCDTVIGVPRRLG